MTADGPEALVSAQQADDQATTVLFLTGTEEAARLLGPPLPVRLHGRRHLALRAVVVPQLGTKVVVTVAAHLHGPAPTAREPSTLTLMVVARPMAVDHALRPGRAVRKHPHLMLSATALRRPHTAQALQTPGVPVPKLPMGVPRHLARVEVIRGATRLVHLVPVHTMRQHRAQDC